MEEAELLKERLQAITNKRRLQEEIAQKRLRIEEEKLKVHHLKKKALREKWLLDGLSTMTPKEQEETLRQSQEDQRQINHLELSIVRLEQEIEDLEKKEAQLSAKEVRVLQRLKSVERTTADIIKAVKAEVQEVQEEPVRDIYDGIPDLPVSYKPKFVRRIEMVQEENGEEPRKALFAMEIKVEKDMKTGKSTVLSSIPVPSSEFKDTGVKVYDDGRKSVFALSSQVTQNGVDTLAPVEVEDLLRKATEKSSQSPTEYHQPVFSNPFNSSTTQKGQIEPRINDHNSLSSESPGIIHQNGKLPTEAVSYPKVTKEPQEQEFSQSQPSFTTQSMEPVQDNLELKLKTKEDLQRSNVMNSGAYSMGDFSSGLEDDIHYNVVQATPCYVDDSEPVTMIFMGYKNADDAENNPLPDYEGVIRAELVVIDDDEDDGLKREDKSSNRQTFHPVTQQAHISKPAPAHDASLNNHLAYKNSISLQEQEARLGHHNFNLPSSQIIDDGTEDPSLTALRIRMAKLGKKVI
ncbi:palmdelphin [Spea bombifrons]|uniref:palmdelphin n=1 Tax=Spea bombifrons TaxID=233779 RepID=UPI002349F6EB|nr:palmdelphin [Spea bombifrons]XP_053324932.1 palmdelphin [Spea bombifrons]